ncbi:hypothetical protein BAE44_0007060, partial [Dichanthelium oligosanthes]
LKSPTRPPGCKLPPLLQWLPGGARRAPASRSCGSGPWAPPQLWSAASSGCGSTICRRFSGSKRKPPPPQLRRPPASAS